MNTLQTHFTTQVTNCAIIYSRNKRNQYQTNIKQVCHLESKYVISSRNVLSQQRQMASVIVSEQFISS